MSPHVDRHFELACRAFADGQTRRGIIQRFVAAVLGGIALLRASDVMAGKSRRNNHKGSSRNNGPDRNRHKGKKHRKQNDKKKRKNCPPCRKAKNGTCKTKRPDGTACGSCQVCQGGQCIAISDGPECVDLSFCYTTIPEVYTRTDVHSLISFRTPAEAENKRNAIIDFLWKGNGLPTRQDVGPPPPDALTSANDGFSVQVRDLVSYVAWWRSGSRKLAIYHAGHNHGLGEFGGVRTLNRLLEQGYDVLGMWMPGFGPNTPL